MSEVRTTAPTTSLSRTSAFQPVASAPALSSPSMMFWRWASKAAPAATQVSFVSVRMTVRPPATIWASVAVVTVPERAAEVAGLEKAMPPYSLRTVARSMADKPEASGLKTSG